jgi:protein arginine N-methyltransferase 1
MQKGKLNEVDERYFASYADEAIHEEMLNDKVRIEAYRHALSGASHDKIVIDVGAGTGILSMMAMDYGAKCVHAIEKTDICQVALKNFRSRLDKRRVLLNQCLAEDFDIGKEKADLIVSEWMGYFLIFENMLPSVLAVRDNCLIEGDQIIPYEASLYMFGYSGEYKDAELDSMDVDQGSSREAVVALLEE